VPVKTRESIEMATRQLMRPPGEPALARSATPETLEP
jgi:hypothetical protein